MAVGAFSETFKNASTAGQEWYESAAANKAEFGAETFTDFKYSQADIGGSSAGVSGKAGAEFANNTPKGQRRKDADKRSANARDQLQLLVTMENQLIDQYGESFAENLFSDLNADGLIEDEDYKRIMAIEDPAERRKAIAEHIQKGLDNGTIKPGDLDDHEWSDDWLDAHAGARAEVTNDAKLALGGQKSVHEVGKNAKDEANERSNTPSDMAAEIDNTIIDEAREDIELDNTSAVVTQTAGLDF